MIDLVLVALLVLTLAALLVVALPAGLGGLAVRNGRKRDMLTQRIDDLEQNLTKQQGQLSPFAGRASKRYQAQYNHIKTQLDTVEVMDQALLRRDSLQFSQLPPNRWAGFYFVRHPGDALAVGQTFWRLRQIEIQASRCETVLQEADAGLKKLETMPQYLQDECRAAQERLTAVGRQLQEEQAWGVQRLEGLVQAHGRLQQELQQLQGQLRRPETISHHEAERIDGELDGAEGELARLELAVSAIQQNRESYAAKEAEAVTVVQRLRDRAATGVFPEELASLLSALENMLQDARQSAQDQAFPRAAARLAGSQQLAEFGIQLIAVTSQIQELQGHRYDAFNRADIEQLTAQLQQVYGDVQQQIWLGGVRQASGVLEPGVVQFLIVNTRQLRQLQTQAQILNKQFREDMLRMERKANQKYLDLNRAWNDMQRTMKLADGEPLAIRYAQSRQQREEAKGSPTRLDAYSGTAAELTKDLRESNAYLQKRLRTLRESVNAMSSFVSTAQAQAGEWRCFQQQANEIREKATAVREIWPGVTQTGCLDKTHSLLDELKLYNQQGEQVYRDMQEEFRQINDLIDQIDKIITSLDFDQQNKAGLEFEEYKKWAMQESEFSGAVDELKEARRLVYKYKMQ